MLQRYQNGGSAVSRWKVANDLHLIFGDSAEPNNRTVEHMFNNPSFYPTVAADTAYVRG